MGSHSTRMFALECVCRPSRPGRLLPERCVLAFRRRRWPPRRCILATRRLWGPGASCPSALAQVVVVSDECRPVRFGRLLPERCVQALRRRRWPLRRLNMVSRDAAVLGPWCERPLRRLPRSTMRNDDARRGGAAFCSVCPAQENGRGGAASAACTPSTRTESVRKEGAM